MNQSIQTGEVRAKDQRTASSSGADISTSSGADISKQNRYSVHDNRDSSHELLRFNSRHQQKFVLGPYHFVRNSIFYIKLNLGLKVARTKTIELISNNASFPVSNHCEFHHSNDDEDIRIGKKGGSPHQIFLDLWKLSIKL